MCVVTAIRNLHPQETKLTSPDAYIKLGTDVFERWAEKLESGDPKKIKLVSDMMRTMIGLAIKQANSEGANIG